MEVLTDVLSVPQVIHPLLQVRADGPCEKLACTHLCVLAPGPRGVCKCPSGLLLADDGLTCSNLVNSAFLLLLSPSTVTQVGLCLSMEVLRFLQTATI